jgi:sulfur-oxidizing protein SoxY
MQDIRAIKTRRTLIRRRQFLRASGGIAAGLMLESFSAVLAASEIEPGTAAAMEAAIREVVGTAQINKGKVTLDLPPLVENGNSVSMTVSVDSPMTEAEHVRAIHVFNEKNPQPNVASFLLGPRCGRARVSTRIRLADTQTIVAICQMSDGSFWSASASVVVTLAACMEQI